MSAIEKLVSLPRSAAAAFDVVGGRLSEEWFAGADPSGEQLGSGGGTSYLLWLAWQAQCDAVPFDTWLRQSRKLIVHGGGQSRRLPAYAPTGKPLIPMPILRSSYGQRLDQTLLDLQAPTCETVLASAPGGARVLVASGDVLVRIGAEMPRLPDADVVLLSIEMDPETASNFGVFVSPRGNPGALTTSLQKPAPERIRELAETHAVTVDIGLWLLSERATMLLMERSGWDGAQDGFVRGLPNAYDLYGQFGAALGAEPACRDEAIAALTCAVAELRHASFHHLGTSRQLIEAVANLQNENGRAGLAPSHRSHPDQIVLNASLDAPTRRELNHTLWIESASIPASWTLAHDHVLTGVPANDWELALEPGVCLDFVPVSEDELCIRAYGIDDGFTGAVGDPATVWLGRSASAWFANRGITLSQAGISESCDIQDAPLFPVVRRGEITADLVAWLFAGTPAPAHALVARWRSLQRLSARQIGGRLHAGRIERERAARQYDALRQLHQNRKSSVFHRMDLSVAAGVYADGLDATPVDGAEHAGLAGIHESMWIAEVLRRRDESGDAYEERAFDALRRAILAATSSAPVRPHCTAHADQIVWARSPVRLDLAGGWTDTPPYCLQHGGSVTNVAVDLNGQPPIQVFARQSERREIVIRSIDLGVDEHVRTYEELDTFARPGSEFALAKAALALAGFLPRFHAEGGFASLEEQLADFGGGIEVSLLAATPKGSGLGTSSILAATLLGALGDLCGHGWDTRDIVARTLALEQMMTTGGGWQDQAGGVLRGIKLLESAPGLVQTVTAHWLPDYLLADGYANRSVMLYYTGITRLAKNILQEIVRGMFLNEGRRLAIIRDIGANASFAAHALQQVDYDALCDAVRRSWDLNQRLDPGTNPPAVQAVLEPVADHLAACKLLGAGGGGYVLMLAKDEEAGRRIRETLTASPPNARARFVNLSVSQTGMSVTRS